MAKYDQKSYDILKLITEIKDKLKTFPALEPGNVALRIKLTKKLYNHQEDYRKNDVKRAALKKQYDKLVEETE
jgi:hypothetical protein